MRERGPSSPAAVGTITLTRERLGVRTTMMSAFETHRWSRAGLALLGFALTTGVIGGVPAVAGQRPGVNLVDMSLEELLTIEVVYAGKKGQLITKTAAAVYVITADDIRRQNASTLADLLRQVPGVLVARETTGKWSISIRGFNNKHANKLLVLMDGRTWYSPLYGGVEWDVQDAMLEDIDRIEVIKGPGAALWGANAVNGVINIIMKPAADTLGGHVALGAGTLEKGSVAARYGGAIGDTAHYRVFSKYFDRASLEDAAGTTPWGGWTNFRQGASVDWSPSTSDTISFTSEWSRGNLRGPDNEIVSFTPPFESSVNEHDETSAGTRGIAAIQDRASDLVRGGLSLRAHDAVVARRGVVLQRVRRSADDRDARELLHGSADRRGDDPSAPCQPCTRTRGRRRSNSVLDREQHAAAQRQLHATLYEVARRSGKQRRGR